ncbi:MAG: class I SAM-dependent methyltransferase [Chloroflexi bacterium]|nr:class I SAM-dependent methyltransferase [Chloroflexota bacterium]
MMIKYYDETNCRLVYVGQEANENFWDSRWQAEDFERLIKVAIKKNRFFVDNTQKYLPPGSRILEGGCGRGDKVYVLQKCGFEAYGVDYASETVEKINRYAPELKVTLGDVRNLDFPDAYFDGYWSLGVIEHFYDGFEPIQREMSRVIKNGGYLFLTVPAMSWLRKQKARLRKYPAYKENDELRKHFYQFALDPQRVIRHFQNHGFRFIELKPRNGIVGLREETAWPPLQRVLDSKTILAKRARKVIDILTTPFANHGVFCVFKKTQ